MERGKPWSRGDKIGLGSLVVCFIGVVTALLFPEVRVWFHLENPADVSGAVTQPANAVLPTSQPTAERAPAPKVNKHLRVGNDNPGSAPAPIAVAPNGIAIAGGTVTNPTVNNFAPPQRTISEQDRRTLIASLSQHPGKVIFGAINAGSSEAFRFAESLREVFKSAGWEVQESILPMMFGGDSWDGIMLCYKGEPNTATEMARELSLELTAAHVKRIWMNSRPDFPADSIRIEVGPNPDQ